MVSGNSSARPGVQEILVDGGQLVGQLCVEVFVRICERQVSGISALKAAVNRLRSMWTVRAIVSGDAPSPRVAVTCARNATMAAS